MISFSLRSWLAEDEGLQQLMGVSSKAELLKRFRPVIEPTSVEGAHILYNFDVETEQFWLIENVRMTIEIWSKSYDNAVEIERYIHKKLNNDSSAKQLQNYIKRLDGSYEYTVHRILLTFGGDLQAPDEQAGDYGRILAVTIRFTDNE